METWQSIAAALKRWDFLDSTDLMEAYLHIPILLRHRCFLRFCYGLQHYQYRALPFGLMPLPWVLTKVLVAAVAHLHQQDVFLYPTPRQHPDSLFIENTGVLGCSSNCVLFQDLGFVINLSKSSLEPVQGIKHLGLWLDTVSFRLYLAQE